MMPSQSDSQSEREWTRGMNRIEFVLRQVDEKEQKVFLADWGKNWKHSLGKARHVQVFGMILSAKNVKAIVPS